MSAMRPWWFWRLSPAPKKRLSELELPWSYLQADRDDEALDEAPPADATSHLRVSSQRWFGALRHGMALIEAHMKSLGLPDDGHLEESPIGAMRALKITSLSGKPMARRRTKRVWWLTPPVEQFADLKPYFPSELLIRELGRHSDHTYWINRDVFDRSSEFLEGSLAGLHRARPGTFDDPGVGTQTYVHHDVEPGVIDAGLLSKLARDTSRSELAEFLLVALDSYLERGPDPRFNPSHTTRTRLYPMASRDLWYSDADYARTGGRLVTMSPGDYLSRVRPLRIDEVAQDNIDDLKRHMLEGLELDPLKIYPDGKEDGRHRAHAAEQLGIDRVPVIVWPQR
jgi:hypothetical protein